MIPEESITNQNKFKYITILCCSTVLSMYFLSLEVEFRRINSVKIHSLLVFIFMTSCHRNYDIAIKPSHGDKCFQTALLYE